jgi:hypothetical protein
VIFLGAGGRRGHVGRLEGRLSELPDPIVISGNESVPIQDIVTGV